MGIITDLFDTMGRKNKKHKRIKQQNHHNNRSDNKHGSNNQTKKVIVVSRRISKENVYEVADTVFGSRYYCVGSDNG